MAGKIRLTAAAMCAAALGAGCVEAPMYQGPVYEDAQVLSTVPVVWQQQVPVQQQVCDPQAGPNQTGSMVGALVGGALGGLAGNQFGKGRGNTAMTVLGVVGGAVAGSEVGANTPPPGSCHVVQSYTWQSVTQYDVTYLYHGQTYHTRLDHDPGPLLRMSKVPG